MLVYAHRINWSTSSAGTPINCATTIIGSLLASAPIHSMRSVAQTVRPQLVEGVGDERLHGANPLGRQLRHEHLAVHGMGRIVGGGEDLCRPAETIQFERDDGALGREHHRRGQVRRKVLGTIDGVVDRGPVAHRVEPGLADPMDRPVGTQAVVERIRILYRIGPEEFDRMFKHCHFSRLTRVNVRGQWPRR